MQSTSSSTSSTDSYKLKKTPKTDHNLDLGAAYNASNVAQNTGCGATKIKDTSSALGPPPPAPTSIKFSDLPVPVRLTRAAPRPVTPYPPPMESVIANEENCDNGARASQPAGLCSPRPKMVFQPLPAL